MATGEPNQFIPLPPIIAGSAFTQVFTPTSNTSDPNGWTQIRFTVVAPDGSSVQVTTPTITKSVTGTGPWVATINVPLTKANTLAMNPTSLPFARCTYQLDYVGSSSADQGEIQSGPVEVVTPDVAMP
jgi:hypothetical protein